MPNTSYEISFDRKNPTHHKKTYSGVINTIKKISNPYIGNKKKLLNFIARVIEKHDLQFNSFFDAFSGSSVVGLFMKGIGKKVLSNDILTSSYLQSVALVENNGIKLSDEHIKYLIQNDNKNRGTFVQDNWMFRKGGKAVSRRFTENEAKQLDNIRANIKDLTNIISQSIGVSASNLLCMRLPFGFIDKSIDIYSHRKRQLENYGADSKNHDRRIGIYYDENMDLNFKEWFPKYVKMLQRDMEEPVEPKINHAILFHGIQNFIFNKCFLKGRYNCGQVLANSEKRVQEDGEFVFSQRELKQLTFTGLSEGYNQQCISTNCDVIELLSSGFVDVDCVYFDPPYGGGSSDYGFLYRFFEEFIYEETIDRLPHYLNGNINRFSGKKNYEDNFIKMLECSKNIPMWMFSFNDSSWNGLDHIVNIVKSFRKNIFIESSPNYQYKYRKDKDNFENEYIILAIK